MSEEELSRLPNEELQYIWDIVAQEDKDNPVVNEDLKFDKMKKIDKKVDSQPFGGSKKEFQADIPGTANSSIE